MFDIPNVILSNILSYYPIKNVRIGLQRFFILTLYGDVNRSITQRLMMMIDSMLKNERRRIIMMQVLQINLMRLMSNVLSSLNRKVVMF